MGKAMLVVFLVLQRTYPLDLAFSMIGMPLMPLFHGDIKSIFSFFKFRRIRQFGGGGWGRAAGPTASGSSQARDRTPTTAVKHPATVTMLDFYLATPQENALKGIFKCLHPGVR